MDDLQSHQPVLTFYLVAKNEMLVRIKERELAIYVWVGVLGTILTIAFHGKQSKYDVLLILPLLAAGISMRISQHETIISKLAKYCKEEIGPILKDKESTELRHWDESKALTGQRQIVGLRNIVNSVLIVGPCIFSIIVTYNSSYTKGTTLLKTAWISGLLFTLLSAYFATKSFLDRVQNALRIVDDNLH